MTRTNYPRIRIKTVIIDSRVMRQLLNDDCPEEVIALYTFYYLLHTQNLPINKHTMTIVAKELKWGINKTYQVRKKLEKMNLIFTQFVRNEDGTFIKKISKLYINNVCENDELNSVEITPLNRPCTVSSIRIHGSQKIKNKMNYVDEPSIQHVYRIHGLQKNTNKKTTQQPSPQSSTQIYDGKIENLVVNNSTKKTPSHTPSSQSSIRIHATIDSLDTHHINNKKNKKKYEKKIKKIIHPKNSEINNQKITNLFINFFQSRWKNNLQFKETIENFISHRKEIKQPLTERACKIIANKCNQYSLQTVTEAINRSIESGWTGVFPESIKSFSSSSNESYNTQSTVPYWVKNLHPQSKY